ncbi:MAG: beta-galactosidase, partial [Nitratireductor sp.]
MKQDALKRKLGVCYYPEHWPTNTWVEDAKHMKDMGLTYVRIGEFAWSKLEPVEGKFEFEWLDKAIQILGEAGLSVVLGTPTATPPRWMVDKYPDMLGVDANGHKRKFGSRRHYCFSHEGYRQECARIVKMLAERYGKNEYISAWQTDNEYSCHDTVISYSEPAKIAFQNWLRQNYASKSMPNGDIDLLNEAWGNVFWSMEYQTFDQIELPSLTVTEPNPAHTLAFRRFSSDQVVSFNKLQTDIIRAFSKAPITHNYMGRITDFDHFAVGEDLDFASWDSYPLGFLEDRVSASDAHKRQFSKQGDPDFQAFHHDLYRAVGKGRWWVMEQQPGPVNWAPHNPAPMAGMVRLWAWEAFARGAEAVCFFRWRQLPFAQEQMHSGLLRPDRKEAACAGEVKQIAQEIANAPDVKMDKAPVAIIFDYDADFAWATQPHGKELNYFDLVFDHYKALRALGLSVDILPSNTKSFDDYALVLAPGLMHMSDTLKTALSSSTAQVVIGPRSGARTKEMSMPVPLAPAIDAIDCIVTSVES